MKYQAMYKSELAAAAGVSRMTFYRWLSEPAIREMLRKEGVSPHCKLLPPKVVKMLCEHFVIEP